MERQLTTSVHDPAVSGYRAWAKPLLEMAPHIFPGYADAMAAIALHREEMRRADITGSGMQKTAGWSPSGNVKMALEMPYEASLIFKAALGPDALTNPRKRRFIMAEHPEFSFKLSR